MGEREKMLVARKIGSFLKMKAKEGLWSCTSLGLNASFLPMSGDVSLKGDSFLFQPLSRDFSI